MSQQSQAHSEAAQNKGGVQYLFVGNKAGLDNVDKDKITKIINDTTQSSEFYKRQQMKREQYDDRIKEMMTIITQTKQDPIKLLKIKQECDDKLDQLKQLVQTDRVWVHFDMDMFFVACELKDRPELKDLPVAVGGMSMISTANYIARKYGVRSAMPGFIAKKLCPQLILIGCNFEKYRKASEQFKQVLYQYDPNLESMGLDEANLDLTEYLQQNDINSDAQIYDLCNQIRKQVQESTGGLTCSGGIGPNKMLAKICSDMNKPNGQFQLANDEEKIKEFMKQLPIRKIPGIGNVTEQILKGIGVETCHQILERVLDIKICFRDLSFDHLVSSALGIGRSQHEEESEKKSLSVSRTFTQISTIEEIHEKIRYISQKLADDAKDEHKVGKHLAVSFKSIKFQTRSKNRMLDKYIQDSESIEKVAKELVKELLPTDPLRLIGIRLSQLADENEIKTQGLNKYFTKNEKSNNGSVFQSSKKSSKQSKMITTQLAFPKAANNSKQNDKTIPTQQRNQNMAEQINTTTDNSFSLPHIADNLNTSQMVDFSSNQTHNNTNNSNNLQPSFLSLIDQYESEGNNDENDSQIDPNENRKQNQLTINRQMSNYSEESSLSEEEDDENDDEDNHKKADKTEEEEDEDDSDDLLYLKKILNKNVSDRLSQISEKKSQEEQKQSLSSDLNQNSMTPQFIFQSDQAFNQRISQTQNKQNQMIEEIPLQTFQSQKGVNQTQYFQRKSDTEEEIPLQTFQSQRGGNQTQYFQRKQDPEQEVFQGQYSNQSFEVMQMSMVKSEEVSKSDFIQRRSLIKPKFNQEKENSNSVQSYDQSGEYMCQEYQYIQSQSEPQSSNKKRVPQNTLTPEQMESQMRLKKKFIPRFFECPICFQQLDSYGNATFVNSHITDCMRIQEEKFNRHEANTQMNNNNNQEQKPVSILNNFNSKQTTKRKNSDIKQRKSSTKQTSGTKNTLDSYIIKQKH